MKKVFYKATRPDGTDFHTGTVLYEVGGKLPFIQKRVGVPRECCTDTVYHASDTPSETLIGGSWPARLFEVTGKPLAQEGHKFGFATLHVGREIEAWRVFGPNGQAVVALLEQASTITQEQALRLESARNAAWDAARDAARNAAWDAARDAARNAAWYAARDAAWYAARDAAWYAAWYAAGAVVVRELISPQQFEALTAPWVSVMGPL